MNLLFICTYNQYRSPTAEHIFKTVSGLSVRSAGTSGSAAHHINSKDLQWADIIFVMEKKHREYLEENFQIEMKDKKIVNLNIPDEYQYMDPELVEMLKTEVNIHLLN
ncbi:MAG: protein tyrosine phosphatase [Patescibacteria group bacterium]